MNIKTYSHALGTQGQTSIYDITSVVQSFVNDTNWKEGQVCVFAIGSTTGITTLEYEPGLVDHDVNAMLEQISPYREDYRHNQTWGDDNGASHLRSFITGTSINVPFTESRLMLGTWQQIVFVDFDTRPRHRKIVIQVWGV